MRRSIFGSVLLSAFVLAACHGNSLGPVTPRADAEIIRPSSASGTESTGKLFITLPGIAPSPEPTPGTTRGFMLGHATTALTIYVNGKRLQKYPIDLAYPSSQSKCVTTAPHSDVSVCTVSVDVPSGRRQTIELTTLQTNAGMKAQVALAVATATVDITPGKHTSIAPAFHAVARRLALQLTSTKMWQNTPAVSLATVYGVDAAGELIPSQDVVDKSVRPVDRIVLSSSGVYPQRRLISNGTGYPRFDGKPYASALFKYDGKLAGVATIAAEPQDGLLATVQRKITIAAAAPGAVAQIFALVRDPSYYYRLVEFSSSATGNAVPLRVVDPAEGPFASDGRGGYWGEKGNGDATEIDHFNASSDEVDSFASPSTFNSGAIDSDGKLVVVSSGEGDFVGNCGPGATLAEFGTELGAVRPGPSQAMNWLCQVPYLSADALGDVYAGEYQENPLYATGRIVEYGPPDATGKRTVIRTISRTVNGADESYSVLSPFAGDAHGNLFAVDDDTPASTGLLEYPAGSTAPVPLLQGISIAAVAIDSGGNIYAEVTSGSGCAIEEFPPGGSTPTRTIAGPAAGLGPPVGIFLAGL
jgi:hypothetical protein